MRISDWSSDVCSSDLIGFAESPGEDREHAGREQASGGNARLRPARPEAAPCGIAMLGGAQHRAAPFAADSESLDQPQDDERARGPDTGLGVGGKQYEEGRGEATQAVAQQPHILRANNRTREA